MPLIDKLYFTLEEVAERWGLPMCDLVYLAENGLLRLSVRLHRAHVERGVIEEVDTGYWERIPTDRAWCNGLEDLVERDAFEVLKFGEAQVQFLHVEGSEYATLIEPTETIIVRREVLLVRRAERDRVEARHDLTPKGRPGPDLRQFDDYRQVRFGSLAFSFGPIQAEVVRRLHAAAKADTPWCVGKVVLADVGAASTRMADIFKSKGRWRDLIESDRRGRYRLRITRAIQAVPEFGKLGAAKPLNHNSFRRSRGSEGDRHPLLSPCDPPLSPPLSPTRSHDAPHDRRIRSVHDSPHRKQRRTGTIMALHHITQIELARRWRLSYRTLERWRWQGTGPRYLKLGKRIVYRLDDIEAFEKTRLHETRAKVPPARPRPQLRLLVPKKKR